MTRYLLAAVALVVVAAVVGSINLQRPGSTNLACRGTETDIGLVQTGYFTTSYYTSLDISTSKASAPGAVVYTDYDFGTTTGYLIYKTLTLTCTYVGPSLP